VSSPAPELNCRVAALAVMAAWYDALVWRLHVRAMLCPCPNCNYNRARWVHCREHMIGVVLH